MRTEGHKFISYLITSRVTLVKESRFTFTFNLDVCLVRNEPLATKENSSAHQGYSSCHSYSKYISSELVLPGLSLQTLSCPTFNINRKVSDASEKIKSLGLPSDSFGRE